MHVHIMYGHQARPIANDVPLLKTREFQSNICSWTRSTAQLVQISVVSNMIYPPCHGIVVTCDSIIVCNYVMCDVI